MYLQISIARCLYKILVQVVLLRVSVNLNSKLSEQYVWVGVNSGLRVFWWGGGG